MNENKSIYYYFYGDLPINFVIACYIAAFAGILLVLLLGTNLRDPLSATSPTKWSWKYLLSDNNKRIMASVLATVLSITFFKEVFNREITVFGSLGIGTGWDGIALFLKQKTKIFDPKP